MVSSSGLGNWITGISLEQLNLYSQLSGELLIPTSIPLSKSLPVRVARICRMSMTGCRIGPNCRLGTSYLASAPLEALKIPSTHISSLNGPRSTITRTVSYTHLRAHETRHDL